MCVSVYVALSQLNANTFICPLQLYLNSFLVSNNPILWVFLMKVSLKYHDKYTDR